VSNQPVLVPDLAGAQNVDVIEVCVAVGDQIAADDPVIVIESDKASMDVPAGQAGQVTEILIKEGDQVNQGDKILILASDEQQGDTKQAASSPPVEQPPSNHSAKAEADAPTDSQPSASDNAGQTTERQIVVPDLGGAEQVEVIEVSVKPGDEVAVGDALIVLESDKASMDVPATEAGKVVSIALKEGDTVSAGDLLLTLVSQNAAKPDDSAPEDKKPTSAAPSKPVNATPPAEQTTSPSESAPMPVNATGSLVYAGPAVRLLARELGVNLTEVISTGPRGRILKEDVQNFVKSRLVAGTAASSGSGLAVAPAPAIDFAKFGEIETLALNKIKRATATNLHRSWVTVPHVTQFDEADITELEAFRKEQAARLKEQNIRLTPIAFYLKLMASALKRFPQFNASLAPDGQSLILKKYMNIGVAVDTPNGLVVPVIRQVDQKGVVALAQEVVEFSVKARNKKLTPNDMQGGCFTISSLGGIGGTQFTPIVNAPEVAILGLCRAQMKPVYQEGEFQPRLIQPLALSYDHRVIDGAEAVRFTSYLVQQLQDIRQLLLY
jgi:pyruvate dehydrogenase E2 component (dihydrolipoamide acetyltransferase)